jgi:hypothetical protein
LEPDLDAARVEGGLREHVFHDAAGQFPGALILLLRDVHPQPWLDVFAGHCQVVDHPSQPVT